MMTEQDGSAAVPPGNPRKSLLAFGAVCVLVLAFRMAFASSLPLSGDEAYHWQWSRNLAFGYYDHPGLTAFLIAAATGLFGHTEFAVRLPATTLVTAAAFIVFLLTYRISIDGGDRPAVASRAAWIAGSCMLGIPVFAFFSVYMSTDPPLIFFWVLTMFLFYRAVNEGTWPSWVGLGLSAGFLVFCKFLGVLLPIALAAHLLLSDTGRRFLRRPYPYVALAVAVLVLVPFLWWNATHGWATFMFNFVLRHTLPVFRWKNVGEYVLGQCVAVSPLLFFALITESVLAFREKNPFRRRAELWLVGSALVPLAYFLFVSTQRRVGLHWPVAGWVGPLILFGLAWARGHGEWSGGAWVPVFRRVALGLAVFLTVLIHGVVHIPAHWIRAGVAYAGQPDRISMDEHAERFGWQELGVRMDQIRREGVMPGGREPHRVFVMASEYGLSSCLSFYMADHAMTHLWSPTKKHGENYRFWECFSDLRDQDAVFVAKRKKTALEALPSLRQHFITVQDPEEFPVYVDDVWTRSFYLVRCRGFDGVPPVFNR